MSVSARPDTPLIAAGKRHRTPLIAANKPRPTGLDPRRASRIPLLTAAMGALALAGCGSSATKTVSVSGAAPQVSTTQPARTTGTTPSSPTTTTPTSTATNTSGAGGAGATRTGAAPAFTKQSTSGEGLSGALAVLQAHGYISGHGSDYHPSQTLRVLVGTRAASSNGFGQQAFFFVGNRYIGTDASESSAVIKVVSQSDTEVALAYPLYRPGDPLAHPSGGEKTVRFQLNNGRLVALDQIPPSTSRTGGK